MRIDNNLTAKELATKSISEKNQEALKAAIQEMGLRETFMKGVYCEQHNPDRPKGDYTHQRHYVWNEVTQKMEELPGIYYITAKGTDKNGSSINNGTLQAKLQGYELTEKEGVYKKGDKNYTYNAQTNCFEEITDIDNIENSDDVNNTDNPGDINNDPSVVDQYEDIVNNANEPKTERKLVPNKYIAVEEIQDWEDGSYIILQYDADGKLIGAISYDADGNIKATNEFEYYNDGSYNVINKYADGNKSIDMYDEQHRYFGYEYYDKNGELTEKEKRDYNKDNSYTKTIDTYSADGNTHTVEKYDADGRMLTGTSIRPDGTIISTKCYNTEDGAHLYIETDPSGNIMHIEVGDEKFSASSSLGTAEEIQKSIDACQQKIRDVHLRYSYLDLPVPPDPKIITDPKEYDKEMEKYLDDKQKYDEECKKINEELISLNYWLNHYENELFVIDFAKNVKDTELEITKLKTKGDTEGVKALQARLDKQIQDFVNSYAEKEKRNWEINDLSTEYNELSIPTPPKKSAYIDANGKFDEVKYNEAMEEYEETKEQYDQTLAQLRKEIEKAQEKNDELTRYLNKYIWNMTGKDTYFGLTRSGKFIQVVPTSTGGFKVLVQGKSYNEYPDAKISFNANGEPSQVILPSGETLDLVLY